jgi:hypothetical protein
MRRTLLFCFKFLVGAALGSTQKRGKKLEFGEFAKAKQKKY